MHFAGNNNEIKVRLLTKTIKAIDSIVGEDSRSWLVDLAVTAYITKRGRATIRRDYERVRTNHRDEILGDA